MKNKDINRIYELLNEVKNEELSLLVHSLIVEHEELFKNADIDVLTNTKNRRVLSGNVKYDIVVMCDVDNFKVINDEFGHSVGDKVLILLSQVLCTMNRKDDLVCRYGGDEFVIILNKCTTADAIKKIENIKSKIIDTMEELDLKVTISFGLAEYEHGKSLKDAIEEADKALYMSKKNGKNTISVYGTSKQLLKK